MSTTALIDGDIIAFRMAARHEEKVQFPGCEPTYEVKPEGLYEHIDELIDAWSHKVGADHTLVALTSPDNWRKKVLPSYKANRIGVHVPALRKDAEDYIRETQDCWERPTLEADDILGILSTHKTLIPGKKVICTVDKDLRQIPGYFYNPMKGEVEHISAKEANYQFYKQCLTGDTVDGFYGCPGMGPKTAEKILDAYLAGEGRAMLPREHEFKRGPRKGQTETRWEEVPHAHIWEIIVTHYEKAGLTEADALQQARVARICRARDYDYKLKEVKLWTPR
jgi:DNA polymerase-1